jgi:hypothetical protein
MKSVELHENKVKTINVGAGVRKKSSGQFRSEFRLEAVCAAREFLKPRKCGTPNLKKNPSVVRADKESPGFLELELAIRVFQTDLH